MVMQRVTASERMLVATGLADAAVAWLAPRPLPWVVLIGASLPLAMFVFVGLPSLRGEIRK
jgi:hypothetical protein